MTDVNQRTYSKKERRELRRLADKAYELELNQSLDDLYREFHRWSEGELLAGELSDAIHRFYRGPSRELFNLYNGVDKAFLVARGLALGLLSEEDVPQPLAQKLESLVRFARTELIEEDE